MRKRMEGQLRLPVLLKFFHRYKNIYRLFFFFEIYFFLVAEDCFPRTYVFASDINQIAQLLHILQIPVTLQISAAAAFREILQGNKMNCHLPLSMSCSLDVFTSGTPKLKLQQDKFKRFSFAGKKKKKRSAENT